MDNEVYMAIDLGVNKLITCPNKMLGVSSIKKEKAYRTVV